MACPRYLLVCPNAQNLRTGKENFVNVLEVTDIEMGRLSQLSSGPISKHELYKMEKFLLLEMCRKIGCVRKTQP